MELLNSSKYQDIRVVNQAHLDQLEAKLKEYGENINLKFLLCIYNTPLKFKNNLIKSINKILQSKNIDIILSAINQLEDMKSFQIFRNIKFREFIFIIKYLDQVKWGKKECIKLINEMNNNIFHQNLRMCYDLKALDPDFLLTFVEKVEDDMNLKASHLALIAETENNIEDSGLDSIDLLNKISIFEKFVLTATVKLSKKFRLKFSFLCVNELRLLIDGLYVNDALKVLSRKLCKKTSFGFIKITNINQVLPLFCIDIGEQERHIDLYQITSAKISKVAFKLILKTNKQTLEKRLITLNGNLVEPRITKEEISFLKRHQLIN